MEVFDEGLEGSAASPAELIFNIVFPVVVVVVVFPVADDDDGEEEPSSSRLESDGFNFSIP